MDQISSNAHFTPAQIHQRQPPANPRPSIANTPPPAAQETQSAAGKDFAAMFNDDSLLKLQSNLEAIAKMAERSLKRIDS